MFFCLNKTDTFGRPVNMTHHGNWNSGFTRQLAIMYRPCFPRQRTEFNQKEGCLIDDVKNKTQLESMLERSKSYVGDAQIEVLVNYDIFNTMKYGEAKL
jgi:hypothetical protein